ncbi:hypothetical protein BKA62DRAFT_686259 [Auriculariales sp. MPI-PUGE-AT-0066]|nr:hypothetical protein BKA62DRAFT_686259 [Auriculariales sp. MPI-PUGE-AT-0066]
MSEDPLFAIESHPDPRIRSQAIATRDLITGTRVLRDLARATVLLPSDKGTRCDWCLRKPTDASSLRRCSRCTVYNYCDPQCQNAHWTRGGHRTLCKTINAWLVSAAYQRLADERRTDALLLSHLCSAKRDSAQDINDFLDLLPHPSPSQRERPPLCPPLDTGLQLDAQALFIRFENNNFVVHSHLVPIAHGVFTLASRAMNHSCAPNAVPVFIFSEPGVGDPPVMEVVLIKDVSKGEEITIPYVDPALDLATRRERLRVSYGFDCLCKRCSRELAVTGRSSGQSIRPALSLDGDPTKQIPTLSARFSDLVHNGKASHFAEALEVGDELLIFYRQVYSPVYPLIANHLTELAKTSWNAAIQSNPASQDERKFMARCAAYITLAATMFDVLGPEGDTGDGPRADLDMLRNLLKAEGLAI